MSSEDVSLASLAMTITVILCTFNRSVSLATTLNSLSLQSLPDAIEWEVLSVDNLRQDPSGG